jgi:hypothetical protein
LTKENFDIDCQIDFWVDGYKDKDFKKVLAIEPGDRLVYYVKGLGFGAICVARSRVFIDWKPIGWKGDIYPCRFERRCELFLPKEKILKVKDILPKLSFVPSRLKDSKYWGVAFRGSLRPIPAEDFRVIYAEMKRRAEKDG